MQITQPSSDARCEERKDDRTDRDALRARLLKLIVKNEQERAGERATVAETVQRR